MVARIEETKDTTCILEKLEALSYDVISNDKKIAFVYRKSSNSNNLRSDIKSAKDACKFNASVKMIYGTSTASM
jgi:hypothetical protein